LLDPVTSYVKTASTEVKDDQPFYTHIKRGTNGIDVSPVVTLAKALDLPEWSFAKKITNQQYFEL
jgi:hypothetical protein